MNCAEIERLLPLYIEGDLPSGQEELVRAHLDDCAECRRSHQWFLSLESSLRGIKRELPAPDKVADGVCLRLGIAPRSTVRDVFFRAPVLTSLTLAVLSLLMFLRRGDISRLLPDWGKTYSGFMGDHLGAVLQRFRPERILTAAGEAYLALVDNISGDLASWIEKLSAADPWILISVYSGLILCLLAGFALFTYKFIHQ